MNTKVNTYYQKMQDTAKAVTKYQKLQDTELGKVNKQPCLGFRHKAEQASDLASNLPGLCPDWE